MFPVPLPARRRPRLKTARAGVVLGGVAAVLAMGVGAGPAQAGPGVVELKSVFASPIKARTYADNAQNEKVLCTPEPAGHQEYGTQVPFDATRGSSAPSGISAGYPASADYTPGGSTGYPASSNYTPANMPSSSSMAPDLQADVSNDLCFGFTLTPNMQPEFVRTPTNAGKRLPGNPVVPDVDATHVGAAASADDETAGAPVDGDDMKHIVVDLPAGFAGNVDDGAQCTADQFAADKMVTAACPASTQVGTAFVRISSILYGGTSSALNLHIALGGAPNISGGFSGGQVFNLAHGPNELGRLGVSVTPASGVAPTKFIARLLLTPDGRVRTITDLAPRHIYLGTDIGSDGQPLPGAVPAPLYVESLGLRAWGKKADHPTLASDFGQWGTDCSTPLSASVAIDTYNGTRSDMTSKPFSLTGCDALPFLPLVSVETAEKRPAVPTATTVTVNLGQTTTGPSTALLEDASVTLPDGLELGAQVASGDGGLKLCSAAAFGVGQTTDNTCPAGSKVGTVSIISPLQALPLVGSVYLGEQPAVGELPKLYVQASPDGATAADAPRIKLVGSEVVDDQGRITTTFTNAPQLRFSQLKLSFAGGSHALFSTPRACGTTTGASSFTSSASTVPVTASSSLTIDQDCATPAFTPGFAMSADDLTSGNSSPTTVSITRPDRAPWLAGASVTLPGGFLANLKSATECPAAQAAAGACGPESRIASVHTTAGVGDAPLALDGSMYLAERQPGSVAGAVIVVAAKLGDLDLGNVVVPAQINLRPTDAGLTLVTTVPTRFRGLALNLREITVRIDRPGFPLNPTACGPLNAGADLTGDGGQAAHVDSAVNYVGCASRGFQPAFAASLTGDTVPGGHPQVNISMTTRPGDSNLKSATVLLPAGVSSDLKNLQNLCPTDVFNGSGACPAGSRAGSATAMVSITDEAITGDVFLVKVAGQSLPGLGLNFTGRYAQRLLSTIKTDPKTGRLITSFGAIPDLPLTKLNLTINGGKTGPIQIPPGDCKANSSWDASFGAQGGQASKVSIPYTCLPLKPSVKWSRKTGITFTVTAPTGQTLKSTKITLPKGFKITKSSKNRKKYIKVKATSGKVKTKYSSTSISLTASGAGPKKITISVKTKAYSLPKTKAYKGGLKKGKKITLKQRTVTSDAKVSSASSTVKLK